MESVAACAPVDYVIVGHITTDIVPEGLSLGGTVSYAGAAALAFGLKVGVLTSWNECLPLGRLAPLHFVNRISKDSTSFINRETENGRVQTMYTPAHELDYQHIPQSWRQAPIVHLGPVVHEVDPKLSGAFPHSLLGITPQGWLRTWDENGRVSPMAWEAFCATDRYTALTRADAVVISIEDVGGSEERVRQLAADCRVLAVTEAENGSRLFCEGREYHFPALQVAQVDAVGAGDIFAAALFYRLWQTRDAVEAARFATQIGSYSVTRRGTDSAPTAAEIQQCINGRG